MSLDLLALAVLGIVVDIGDNLTDVLLQLLSLLGLLFVGQQAVSARRKVEEVSRETKPNGGSSMRDVVNRTEDAARRVEAAISSLHTRATGEPPPNPD